MAGSSDSGELRWIAMFEVRIREVDGEEGGRREEIYALFSLPRESKVSN